MKKFEQLDISKIHLEDTIKIDHFQLLKVIGKGSFGKVIMGK